MATRPRIGVILTQEARQALKDESIQILLNEGRYFNCDSIQDDGYFLLMKVASSVKGTDFVVEVSIPKHFVLYTLSADALRVLGFQQENKCG